VNTIIEIHGVIGHQLLQTDDVFEVGLQLPNQVLIFEQQNIELQ
jgi:hypothetical protein